MNAPRVAHAFAALALTWLTACRAPNLVGLEPAHLVASPARVSFASTWVGARSAQVVEWVNTGGARATAAATVEAPFAVDETPFTLARAESSSRTVTFSPVAPGHFAGTLRVGELEVWVEGEAEQPPLCIADSPCTPARFDAAQGRCLHDPAPDGQACATLCVPEGVCAAGACAGPFASCDDGDACTVDACASASGCQHVARVCPAPGNPCLAARCSPGAGCGTDLVADGTPCGAEDCSAPTLDVCIAGQCVQRPQPSSARCSNRWVPSAPAGGYRSAGAYDLARRRGVALMSGESWEWAGGRWVYQPSVAGQPAAGVMAYDEARQRTVVVGGALGAAATTWEWDGQHWRELHPPVAPAARSSTALAYDSVRHRVVLFGGDLTSNFGHPLADTWEWDGVTWQQRFPAHAPSARSQHALAFDAARGSVVLFGGWASVSQLGNDTWTWDGTDWKRLSPPTVPPGRVDHAMAYDSARQRVVLFGGYVTSAAGNETWEFDGATWALRPTTSAPPARLGHAMAYDATTQKVLLFGGEYLSDVWEYDGVSWVERTPLKAPAESGALAYDSLRARYVLVGGSHTWEWDGASGWMLASSAPSAMSGAAATFDAARGRVVLVGGGAADAGCATWEWDGAAWAQAATAQPAPPTRFGHALGYDSARHRVVLFGGFISRLAFGRTLTGYYSSSVERDDTWEFDGSTWLALPNVAPGPSRRGGAAFAYDGARGGLLLVGGESTAADAGFVTTVTDDAWGYDGARWAQRSGLVPPARSDGSMAYDSSRGVGVLFGGTAANGTPMRDTWEWNGAGWAQRLPTYSPPSNASLVYDSTRRQVAAFDGRRVWWLNN